jgi:pimeloyl-ACP methyl ester carboxylesterase
LEPATPVVLVHGLWHGSWCWTPLIEELAARGLASVAVDLAGHGLRSRSPHARWSRPFDPAEFAVAPSPVADVTATSAAALLIEQIRRVGDGRPCVVVAHSMGGSVATAAAEQAPELFRELVYVTAFAPINGAAANYVVMPENEGEMVAGNLAADPMVIGALRQDVGDRAGHARLRETFYNDVDEVTADAAIALLTPDGPLGIAAEDFAVTAARYGTVLHTYVVCTRDNAIRPELQRRFIQEIDKISAKPTTVVELDASHSPFLSQPAVLAGVIKATVRPTGDRA